MNELTALLQNSSEIRLYYSYPDALFVAERIRIGGIDYKSATGKTLEEAIEGIKNAWPQTNNQTGKTK